MSEKKSSQSRRKALKQIAAGSGAVVAGSRLPENWTKPVIDSVILPSHAETSPATTTPAPTAYFTTSGTVGQYAVTLCSSVIEGSAQITGQIGSVVIAAPAFAVPGSTTVVDSGTNYIIDVGGMTGTAPNRQINVTIELTGTLVAGPVQIASPETPSC